MANLVAPKVQQQAVSVTRKMSASLPGLRDIAAQRGLKVQVLKNLQGLKLFLKEEL